MPRRRRQAQRLAPQMDAQRPTERAASIPGIGGAMKAGQMQGRPVAPQVPPRGNPGLPPPQSLVGPQKPPGWNPGQVMTDQPPQQGYHQAPPNFQPPMTDMPGQGMGNFQPPQAVQAYAGQGGGNDFATLYSQYQVALNNGFGDRFLRNHPNFASNLGGGGPQQLPGGFQDAGQFQGPRGPGWEGHAGIPGHQPQQPYHPLPPGWQVPGQPYAPPPQQSGADMGYTPQPVGPYPAGQPQAVGPYPANPNDLGGGQIMGPGDARYVDPVTGQVGAQTWNTGAPGLAQNSNGSWGYPGEQVAPPQPMAQPQPMQAPMAGRVAAPPYSGEHQAFPPGGNPPTQVPEHWAQPYQPPQGGGQDFRQAPSRGRTDAARPDARGALASAGVDLNTKGRSNSPAPKSLGIPLSPEFEAGRRALDDALSATLMNIGVAREDLGRQVELIKARLATDLAEEQRQVNESSNARGIYNSGIRGRDLGRAQFSNQRQVQDVGMSAAQALRDLATQESGARSDYFKSLAELMMDAVRNAATDPNSIVVGMPDKPETKTPPAGGTGQGKKPPRRRRGGKGKGKGQAKGKGGGKGGKA